jgi:hypothetical protein
MVTCAIELCNGRISKRGSKLLRTMLLQCAWSSLRYNRWSKKTYDRITGGSKTRRKKAGIALARKIGVIAWAMMRDQTNWDASKLLSEEEAKQDNGKLKVKRKPPGPVHSQESSRTANRRKDLTTKPRRQTQTGNRRTQTVQLQ